MLYRLEGKLVPDYSDVMHSLNFNLNQIKEEGPCLGEHVLQHLGLFFLMNFSQLLNRSFQHFSLLNI